MCAALRRAARAVTRLYDDALKPAGLHTTQFTTLLTLDRAGPLPQRDLADFLLADQTTLSRTLTPLETAGWIHATPGQDKRERLWSLTPKGRRQLAKATPHWNHAQSALKNTLKSHHNTTHAWPDLLTTITTLGTAAA
jgi:DNA-binding MarR family transcriptional regulator